MNALSEKQAVLQDRVNGFQPGKDDYNDLQTWGEQIEGVKAKLEEVELKWLELADRA